VTLRSHSKEESLRGVTPRGHSFCRPSRREERALRPAPRRAWHGCSALPADDRRPPLGAPVITVSGFPDRSKSRFVTHLKRKGPMSRQQLERYLHSHGLCHTCPDCTSSIACTAKWRRECAEQPAAGVARVQRLLWQRRQRHQGRSVPGARRRGLHECPTCVETHGRHWCYKAFGETLSSISAHTVHTAYNQIQIQNCSMQLPLR
jgi:hypothetical protein